MRRTHPEAERPFRAPFSPVTPILGILICLLLMFSLPPEKWWRLFAWLAIGMVIYWVWSNVLTFAQQYAIMRHQGVKTGLDNWLEKTFRKAEPSSVVK